VRKVIPRLRAARRLAMTLAIGAAGGSVAYAVALPLAWILGPACAVALAGFAGAPLGVPKRVRSSILVVLGTFIGGAFSPQTLEQIHLWPVSLAAVVLYFPLVTVAITAWYVRVARLDPLSAFFAATPGGLASMVLLGGQLGGDEPRIALLQSLRVLTLVVLAPLLVIGLVGDVSPGLPQIGSGTPLALGDGLLLLGGVLGGVLLAAACRLPAPQITGSLVVSSALHVTGTVSGSPPGWLLLLTLVVLGSALGGQFVTLRLVGLARIGLAGLSATLALFAFTALASYLLAGAIGLPFVPLLLAMAPGGVPEMSLIALAMGIDPAFVALHHLARMTVILLVVPQVGRLIARRYPLKARDPEPAGVQE
jgi:hypothetical protein